MPINTWYANIIFVKALYHKWQRMAFFDSIRDGGWEIWQRFTENRQLFSIPVSSKAYSLSIYIRNVRSDCSRSRLLDCRYGLDVLYRGAHAKSAPQYRTSRNDHSQTSDLDWQSELLQPSSFQSCSCCGDQGPSESDQRERSVDGGGLLLIQIDVSLIFS